MYSIKNRSDRKKLPSLEKEGWQSLRLTGWFDSPRRFKSERENNHPGAFSATPPFKGGEFLDYQTFVVFSLSIFVRLLINTFYSSELIL